MKEALDFLPLGVFVLDNRLQVVWANVNIERYFGIPSADLEGRDKRALIRNRIAEIFEDPEEFEQRVLATYDNNTYVEKFLCHVLPGPNRVERWLEHFSQPIYSGVFAGGRIELYTDVTERIAADEHIGWLSSQLMRVQEREKTRIARDLHDELGQGLVAQKIMLENLVEALRADGNQTDVVRRLEVVIRELSRLSHEVRRISSDLMPTMLEPLGLQETMLWLRKHYEGLYQLKIDFQTIGFGPERLPARLELMLFRIFQEALNNIVKHAGATTVEAKLLYNYPRVIASIRDDGRGFQQGHMTHGLGLRFMRQRVAEMGGSIKIKSAPGEGTLIRVEIPYYGKGHHQENEAPAPAE